MANRTAADVVPAGSSLEGLRRAAAECTACPLYARATQTVFGEGGEGAELMVVGEQPGDVEDRRGRPFVGPAGRLLRECLATAGLSTERIYVTNVVKHFKWTRQGKRRLHQRPGRGEIAACRPWLDAELEVVAPEALLILGATAAKALLGQEFQVTRHRGELIPSTLAPLVMATVHPSSILRAGDGREEAMAAFLSDLGALARELARMERDT